MLMAVCFIQVIDRESPRKGITELRYIDPRKIKKIREVRKKRPDGPVPTPMVLLSLTNTKNTICLMKKV